MFQTTKVINLKKLKYEFKFWVFGVFQEDKFLYRAIKFAEYCLDYTKQKEEYSPDRPVSLHEGISGPMYLLLDIQDPENAKFPGFTL